MLVLLRHTAPNDLFVEVIELTPKIAMKYKVDRKKGIYKLHGYSGIYKIGEDCHHKGRCPHGFIGLFNTDNTDHMNAMLKSAYERTHEL